MREIKFRAWNGKQMIYLSEQYLDRYYMQIDNQAWGVFDKENSFGAICNSHNKNDVLMQFTGLKDKNGVEVFEGDKVRGKTYTEGVVEGVVAWYEDRWVVQYNNGLRISLMYFKWIEVIGNIYENANLLNDERVNNV